MPTVTIHSNARRPQPRPARRCGTGLRRGFTLVELLVTLAVAGIFLAFVYQIFITQQRNQLVQEEMADAQQNGRLAVEELTRTLASLGAGVDPETGQVRVLLAHEYEIVFNADLSQDAARVALPHGTPLTFSSITADDPYDEVPGAYSNASDELPPAELYRYYLAPEGDLYILYREMGSWDRAPSTPPPRVIWSPAEKVALLMANPRLDDPTTPGEVEGALFSYYGDFDGDGVVDPAPLTRVDRTTSSRIAAGEPLDAVIQRIGVEVVTATAHPDPRYPEHDGYRLTTFRTAVAPRNLWDCPMASAVAATVPGELPAPDVVGATTDVEFLITRGGVPEAGRRVEFTLSGPPAASVTPSAVTGADGKVTATITWPTECDDTPLGTYTLAARTATPPPLATSFGACAPHEARVDLVVVPGGPDSVAFGDAVLRVPSCGAEEVSTSFRILDGCGNLVRDADAAATFVLRPDPDFGTVFWTDPGGTAHSGWDLTTPEGTVTYRPPDSGPYESRYAVIRSVADPNVFPASVDVTSPAGGGSVGLDVYLPPQHVVGLTRNIEAVACTDCPSPTTPVADSFGVEDACDNALVTLVGTGASVRLELVPEAIGAVPPPDQGAIASPGNRAALSPDPLEILQHGGTPRVFGLEYLAPTCTVGALTYHPQLTLTPSWDPAAVETLAATLAPCTNCGVEVRDASGTPTTHLNRECDAESEVVVTRCVPGGTAAELVIEPEPGSFGMPSFDRTAPRDSVTVTFTAAAAGEVASAPLYIGMAQSGDSFRIVAYLPDRASVAAGLGMSCATAPPVTVDTSCAEILISEVPDNSGAVPASPAPEDTPLCASEGNEVYFRVEDCDQNHNPASSDDIRWTAGTTSGLQVEVVDADGTILDRESPDLIESDVHGTRAIDSSYFQGHLPVTQDPLDGHFSGRLRAPLDRIVTVRARYVDPDDRTDFLCLAEALLIPPVPVCLARPVNSWADWAGDLLVHGGDAAIFGDLLLPALPRLVAKDRTAPPAAGPYGSSPADRFFNAYVGGTFSLGGSPLAPAKGMDQPFTPDGAGSSTSTSHPDYFRSVPDVASLLSRLDYDQLRLLAKALRVYWEAEPGGTIFNPVTRVRGTFQEITALPGPGIPSPTHDGRFLFVDAPATLASGSAIDAAPLADLPVYEVTGDYYTEGLLYVAGSVVFAAPLGTGQAVDVVVGATEDSRYDEGTGDLTRADLPVDFAPSSGVAAAGSAGVHLNGALYCDGEIRLAGGPRIFGAIVAERGVRDAGSAEIWYDPRWRESRLEACSRCCGLAVDPVAPTLSLGDTLALTALDPAGTVTWTSSEPSVATVDPATGEVAAVAEGVTVVRAADTSGCVAETEVRVGCALTLESSAGTDLRPGDVTTVSSAGRRGTLTWSSDTPSTLEIVRNFGVSVDVEARDIGGARLTADDSIGCGAFLDFTVNCPAGRALRVSPTAPAPGDVVTLAAFEGTANVTSEYFFFADGSALPSPFFTVPDLTPIVMDAALPGGGCRLGPITVTPAPSGE